MSLAGTEERRWSGARWALAIAAVTLVQAGFVWRFSQSAPAPARTNPAATHYQLVSVPERAAAGPTLDEPTLFALADARGFSGRAWLTPTVLTHQFTNWSPAPELLRPDPARLGTGFVALVRNGRGAVSIAAQALTPTVTRLEVPEDPLPTQSSVHVEGELAGRPALTLPAPPVVAHTELLSNSVVRVVVDAAGFVRSAALLGTSGARTADQLALDLARTARFESLPRAEPAEPGTRLTFGRLVFRWLTRAPEAAGPGNAR